MKVTINGTQQDVSNGLTVTQLLAEQKVKMPEMVSVELNGQIVDRPLFATTTVSEGDTVEFLYYMGGGTYA